jgi:hypothetical protein
MVNPRLGLNEKVFTEISFSDHFFLKNMKNEEIGTGKLQKSFQNYFFFGEFAVRFHLDCPSVLFFPLFK